MRESPFGPSGRPKRVGGVWEYISVSRLNLWLKCPLAFKARYIDGAAEVPSASQFVGRRVHAGLEDWYRQWMSGRAAPASEVVDRLKDTWRERLDYEGNPFGNERESQAACLQTVQLVETYLRERPTDEGVPQAVECAWQAPLIDPIDGHDFGVPLAGIIDLLLESPDGSTIVDFKTAARGGRPLPFAHEIQLTGYGYLVRQITGRVEHSLEIRQLVKGKSPRLERYQYPPITEQQLRRFFAVVRAYLAALDRGEFVFRPHLLCGSCEFLETVCRAWGA